MRERITPIYIEEPQSVVIFNQFTFIHAGIIQLEAEDSFKPAQENVTLMGSLMEDCLLRKVQDNKPSYIICIGLMQ